MRRLPVIQSEPPEDGAAGRRPFWQWWVIGVLSHLVLWLPLSLVAIWVGTALTGTRATGAASPSVAATVLGSYVAASGLTAVMLGRFAPRLGYLSSALTSVAFAFCAGLTVAAIGALPWPAGFGAAGVLSASGALGSAIGFFFGRRRRSRATRPVDPG